MSSDEIFSQISSSEGYPKLNPPIKTKPPS